jgi:fumarylacetoacetate (FAA) hydrolase
MKLVTFDVGSGPMAGVLQEDRVLDAAQVLGVESGLRDVQALLELPDQPLERLRSSLGTAGAGRPLSSVQLLSPVLRPPTVRDFMVYEGHASAGGTRKLSEAWYRLPVFYFSNTLRIFGPDADIPFPSASERLDYELEIGLVVGREGSDIHGEDWLQYAAGFTIFNDWSCRDLQSDEMQVGLGPAKGKDAASSLGPCVVTLDELGASIRDGRLHGRCSVRVNGDLWMENDAGTAYHDWGAILERAARDSRIVPGDVLGSGTVSGGTIGEAIRNGYKARYLQAGDTVEMEVEGLGTLRNRLSQPVLSDPNYRFKAKPITV